MATRLLSRRPLTPRFLSVLVGALLVAGALVGAVGASAQAVVVEDHFDRQVASGWGSASSGHAYATGSPARLSVAEGTGQVDLVPGAQVAAVSQRARLADAQAKVVVSFGEQGGADPVGTATSVLLRRSSLGFYYEARVRLLAQGRVALSIRRSDRGPVPTLAGEAIVATGVSQGQRLTIEFAATGKDDVTLKARAWAGGVSVPPWQLTAVDSSGRRIAEGSPGLRFESSSGAQPVTVRVHELRAADVEGGVAEPGQTLQLTDDFSRSSNEGWGASTSGALYTTGAPTRLAVDGERGTIELPAGKSAAAVAEGVFLQDAQLKVDLDLASLPPTSEATASAVLRRTGLGTYYAARLRHAPGQGLTLAVDRVTDGQAVPLSTPQVILPDVSARGPVTLEMSVRGTSPVELRARAWRTGAVMPAWQVTVQDSSASRVSKPGAPALVFEVAPTGADAVIRVDNLATSAVSSDTPTPSRTPSPTPSPTPAPSSAPTPTVTPPPPTESSSVGSAPVGRASYPIPAGAVFVEAAGRRDGTGTQADPYGSLGFALEKAQPKDTLVLRGGTYHESVLVDRRLTGVTIQNYPGEAAWLDGSRPVTSWARNGSRWVSAGWNAVFDHRIMSGSVDETSRWVHPDRPLASHPDQVWIDGRPLTQVASESQVTAGRFFVDDAGRRLVVGDDPAGKAVRASALQRGMEIHAEDATVRGIGVRRYATGKDEFGAVIAGVSGITFENVVVSENAWVGVAAWASGQRYRNVTISDNAIMGLGGNNTNDLVVERSVFRGNNAQGFKPTPVAAGIKITRAKNVVLRDNVVADTDYAGGIWFDVSSSWIRVVGNSVFRNTAGIMIELSEEAVIADNHVFDNVGTGVRVQGSGSVDIWNNTIVGNPRPLAVWADERRQEVASLVPTIPWVVDDIGIHNNVVSMTGANTCPILTQDETQRMDGNDFGITSNHNLFHRRDAATPANFACWANGLQQVRSFKTLQQFRDYTGNDKASQLAEGAAIVGADGQPTAAAREAGRAIATSLPAAIASAVGEATGAKGLGAFTGRRG